MRKNLPVTGREQRFDADKRLISTTDAKGVIQYVNDDFCAVAGFRRDELIGQAHNIIRHPDMPPAVFQDFWDTLKAGRPWMGIVKNRCKNGDHYWVNAYVAPVFEHGRQVGFQSVRTAPDDDDVRRAERLYQQFWKGRRHRWRFLPGLRGRIAAATTVGVLGGFGAGSLGGTIGAAAGLVVLAAAGASAVLAAGRLHRLRQRADALFDNRVARRVYGGADDDAAQLLLEVKLYQARERTLLGRIGDLADQLRDAAATSEQAAERSGGAIQSQQEELTQVATAMNQMSATVAEVSRNTSHAASRSEDARSRAQEFHGLVRDADNAMNGLGTETRDAGTAMQLLLQRTEGIQTILDTIRGIAEQTNLLALNAAIEAARAGDSGRGFSVVADEVRQLSRRTGEATADIESVLGEIRTSARQAATAMERGQTSSEQVQAMTRDAADAVEGVLAAVAEIADMSHQIASSTEQQSATAEQINQNVNTISHGLAQTSETAATVAETTETLTRMTADLGDLVRQFR